MSGLVIIGAIIVALYGFTMLTEATFGVGVIALSLLVAVIARLVQAESMHRASMKKLDAIAEATKPRAP